MPLKVDVIRDRGALARVVEDGVIENVYRLQIMNTQEEFRRYRISVSGIEGISIASEQIAEVPGAAAIMFPLRVQVPPARGTGGTSGTSGTGGTSGTSSSGTSGAPGSNKIAFDIRAINHATEAVREKSVFLIPRAP